MKKKKNSENQYSYLIENHNLVEREISQLIYIKHTNPRKETKQKDLINIL